MTGCVLDTSAYSWALRGHAEIADHLRRVHRILVPPIVVGELLAGFARAARQTENKVLLREFLGSPRVTVPPVTEATAERYALIIKGLREQGTPIPTNDAWIAAVAMEAGLPVLTTDAHYTRVSQVLVEFFDVTSASP